MRTVGTIETVMRHGRLRPPWVLVLAAIPWAAIGPNAAGAAPGVHLAATGLIASPKFADLRERGRRAYREERFEEARRLWSAAAALKPNDAETVADLAVVFEHLGRTDDAIQANRDAIRLASALRGSGDRARRIRRAAFYNLGKLKAGRKLTFSEGDDEPSSCVSLASESGCRQPVFACGRTGAMGGKDGRFDYTAARFALDRQTAQIAEDNQLVAEFESWVDFGSEEDATRDRSDASLYDVTLELSSQTREPLPGEADATVATKDAGCMIVHVDACARRLGLYCEWDSWERGVTAKPRSKAIELTFARAGPLHAP